MKNKLPWLLLVGVASYLVVRRLGTRSGATDDEVNATLPGDDVIPHPVIETTHAINIDAPPSAVWRWLIQAGHRGAGRAGWYTDSWIDTFLDRVVFRSTVPADLRPEGSWMHSADEILPDFQHTAVGDVVPDGPPGSAHFVVKAVEPERAWVLYSDTHIRFLSPQSLRGTALEASGEFTWVFVLNPLDDQRTRFILRTRARYGPPLFRQLSLPLIYLAETLFPRFLLHEIKKRAEKEQGR